MTGGSTPQSSVLAPQYPHHAPRLPSQPRPRRSPALKVEEIWREIVCYLAQQQHEWIFFLFLQGGVENKEFLVFLRKNKVILSEQWMRAQFSLKTFVVSQFLSLFCQYFLKITNKVSHNSPFYCIFVPKMVVKTTKYKALGNKALSEKWGKIRIFLWPWLP